MNLLNTNQAISPLPAKFKQPASIKQAQNSPNQISFPKMKPILGKNITFRCSITSSLAHITKCRPKMLSTIELVSFQSNQPNFKNIRTICKAFQDTKRASSLIIRKDESNTQKLKQLKHLFNNSHHHWKKLSITYIGSGEEEYPLEKEVIEILTRLRRYQDLSTLDVNVCCTEDLKNHILSPLLQQLKGLKNLKILNLDLSGCKNREELPENYEPKAPAFMFKYPRSLKYFNLYLGKTDLPNQKVLSIFASNLSRCNSLISFHLDYGLNHYKPSESKALAPLFERGVQGFKSFKISRFFPPHLQLQDSLDFIKDFDYFRYLLDFTLFIFFCLPEDTCIIFGKSLFNHLASLTNLRSFTLTLFMRKFSSDEPAEQNLFLPLQALINLETLRLGLQCDEDKELPALQSLSQALQSLHYLKNFEIFFLKNKVSRSNLICIPQMFKNLTSLQTLNLLFYDGDLESDSLELLSKGISHLKLSSFTFNTRQNRSSLLLPFTWKDHKGLTSFFSALYDFTSLLNLDINLSVFDIPTKDMKSFSLALREMKQLSYLSLELPQFDPGWMFQGLRSFLSSLKEMTKLSYLELIFKGDKLCDEEVEFIDLNLTQCSSSLKTLDLDFSGAQELKNRSILALQNALQSLFSLKNLALAFGPKNVFNRETVYGLFEALGFLKNLEVITLEFPPEVVPLDLDGILRKFAGHWNLRFFMVNQVSWLKSVD